jgi:hypothetical protein
VNQICQLFAQEDLGAAGGRGAGIQSQSRLTPADHRLFPGARDGYNATAFRRRHRLSQRPFGLVWQTRAGLGALAAPRHL